MVRSLLIREKQVAESLPIKDSIRLARGAYVHLAMSEALNPERTILSIPLGASLFTMPAHILGSRITSVKIARLNPRNHAKHLPSVIATVYVYDASTGQELARIEANNLTAIRTAASTAVATNLLAQKNIETLGILGTGKQARAHVPALLAVRDFSRILAFSPNRAHRKAFAREMTRKFHVRADPAKNPREVAKASDVLILATNSTTPLFSGKLVRPGTHVNAMGAALPKNREVDSHLVKSSFLVVDSLTQAKSSYGDIMIPLKDGAIKETEIHQLGDLLVNPTKLSRVRGTTLFKSGGLAALDAVFAEHVVSLISDKSQ
jgi:ornithine cyclodeaminase/alanine dehydrogenase-like protein (mu-crystallin family)